MINVAYREFPDGVERIVVFPYELKDFMMRASDKENQIVDSYTGDKQVCIDGICMNWIKVVMESYDIWYDIKKDRDCWCVEFRR